MENNKRVLISRRRKERKIRGVREPRRSELEYLGWLNGLIRAMERDVKSVIIPVVNKGGVFDSPTDDLSEALKTLARKYDSAAKFYEGNAEKFVRSVSERNARSFERSVPSGIGVDINRIIHGLEAEETLKRSVKMNVSLIKSIPEEYFSKIERGLWVELTGSNPDRKSLIDLIAGVGKVSRSRAKMIARDQTSKINSSLTVARATDIGSDEYIWRNVQDERVVGKPGGLYPDGNRMHGDHYKRNGKRYRFDSPPSDGHPGEPIGCRCWMEPVIIL